MTIWDFLLSWRTAKARDVAETALAHARNRIGRHDKRIGQLETELLQTKRAGYADLAKDLGCSVEEIMDGKIEPMLHDDPQAVYRALDNATASEVKFRLVKVVNRELRLVIRNIIDGLYRTKLDDEGRMFLELAEPYAVPRVMEDKRKVLGRMKRKTLLRKTVHLNYPKGDDNEAQTQADQDHATTAKDAASTKAETGDRQAEV